MYRLIIVYWEKPRTIEMTDTIDAAELARLIDSGEAMSITIEGE